MSKFTLFITALYVSLCPMGTYAQEVVRQAALCSCCSIGGYKSLQ